MESRTVPESPDGAATPAATKSHTPGEVSPYHLPDTPSDTELLEREVVWRTVGGLPIRLRWRDVITMRDGTLTERDTLDSLVREIKAWQTVTFPHCTAQSAANHLLLEAVELADQPTDGGEQADIFLLLVANSTAAGTDLVSEIRAKLEKNKRRTWGKPREDGVVLHTSEGSAEGDPVEGPHDV